MNPLPNLAKARKHLQAAINRGGNTHTFEDVVLEVLRGDMQLWATDTATAVTQINVYPQGRKIHWIWAGGEMGQVLDLQDSVREFGRINGCNGMTLAGRSGWQRTLKSHGWKPQGVIMEAAI